jgi:hypothetical protein
LKLPEFDDDGLLPPGDYALSLAQLKVSMLVTGPQSLGRCGRAGWDSPWRATLVDNLAIMVGHLWRVGVTEVFVDGSFVEDKCHPNDIDGYFHCDLDRLASGDLERRLNALDPRRVWTWDPALRRAYRGYPKRQLPMWHAYRVELYPHVGQLTGIRDRYGRELEFPSAFRISRRNDAPKGIIKLEGP